jgi:hypothetical protein
VRRNWILALLAGGLFLVACSSGNGPSESESTPVPLPSVTPFSAEFKEGLHEIRDGVARIRELPAKTDITEGTVSREALREYYAKFRDDEEDEKRDT